MSTELKQPLQTLRIKGAKPLRLTLRKAQISRQIGAIFSLYEKMKSVMEYLYHASVVSQQIISFDTPFLTNTPAYLDPGTGSLIIQIAIGALVGGLISAREFRKRYALRAGIEGTNSELKRAHGLGRLRVRGGRRVILAVYLKALACNIKRMVQALLEAKFRRPCVEQAPVAALA